MIDLRYHPSTEPWLPRAAAMDELAGLLAGDVRVHVHRRADVDRVWRDSHGGQPLPVSPWAFRAWARGPVVRVFVDETETPASTAWLLLHELAHVALGGAPYLAAAYRRRPKPPGYLAHDDVHEAWPEEQLANHVATELLPVLGHPSGDYSRRWWRRRVQGRRGGQVSTGQFSACSP